MKKYYTLLKSLTAFLLFAAAVQPLHAQNGSEWSVGADLVNRYVWRGVLFDNSVNVQPWVMYTTGGFEAGVASSTSFTNPFNEISIWTGYTVSTAPLDLYFYVGDFYYESGSANFLDFGGVEDGMATGGHYVEGYVSLYLNDLPLSVLFSTVFWNDPDNSSYAQLTYHGSFSGMAAAVNLGMALNRSDTWYYTDGPGVVNLSLELTRELPVSSTFSLPVTGEAIFNPYSEAFYVVLRLSL